MKSALITGITGQDGSYLAKFLLDKGYLVVGTHRSSKAPDMWRLRELGIADHSCLRLAAFDLDGLDSSLALLKMAKPGEVYNLAGQSSAVAAAEDPHGTAVVNGMGALHLLEAVRRADAGIRIFQACSAELFGDAAQAPQNEATPFRPGNSYAVSKLFAHWANVNYREAYEVFACSGLLFNHESPLRGEDFVTRKIARSMAAMRLGSPDHLQIGDLGALRDWGFAGDYVAAMWRMLQASAPDTYVVATGRTHSVRDFVEKCAFAAGFEVQWQGAGMEEFGTNRADGRVLVRVNPAYCRPPAAWPRVGDASRAEREIGWRATTSIDELCRMMVDADTARLSAINVPARVRD